MSGAHVPAAEAYPGRELAIETLLPAWKSGQRIGSLPEGATPQTLEQAHGVQDAMVSMLGEPVAGWKVSVNPAGKVIRGAILASRVFPSPAIVKGDAARWVGVEAEIAFRFDRDLEPRAEPYEREELASAVTAFVAIEIVGSRFADYKGAPALAKTADFMSNEGLVSGQARHDWRTLDLAGLEVEVSIDGVTVSRKKGAHAAGDPFDPVVPFVNALRHRGIRKGQFVTTGACSDLVPVGNGRRIEVKFDGFGTASMSV